MIFWNTKRPAEDLDEEDDDDGEEEENSKTNMKLQD